MNCRDLKLASSRRRAKLDRFTIERLIAKLKGLGQEAEVTVDVHPRQARQGNLLSAVFP